MVDVQELEFGEPRRIKFGQVVGQVIVFAVQRTQFGEPRNVQFDQAVERAIHVGQCRILRQIQRDDRVVRHDQPLQRKEMFAPLQRLHERVRRAADYPKDGAGAVRTDAPPLLFPKISLRSSKALSCAPSALRVCGRGGRGASPFSAYDKAAKGQRPFVLSQNASDPSLRPLGPCVGAVACPARRRDAAVRTDAPPLLFPKISLRCDFREPCRARRARFGFETEADAGQVLSPHTTKRRKVKDLSPLCRFRG